MPSCIYSYYVGCSVAMICYLSADNFGRGFDFFSRSDSCSVARAGSPGDAAGATEEDPPRDPTRTRCVCMCVCVLRTSTRARAAADEEDARVLAGLIALRLLFGRIFRSIVTSLSTFHGKEISKIKFQGYFKTFRKENVSKFQRKS